MNDGDLLTGSIRTGRAARALMPLLLLLVMAVEAVAQGQSSLRVLYPNGGETLVTGSVANIRWISNNVTGLLNVEYSVDSGATWRLIDTVTAANGPDTLAWTVPNDTTTKAFVRVQTADGARTGRSARAFTISTVPPKTLRVIYPNGRELFEIDSTIKIFWTLQNVTGQLNVEYSVDSGAVWKPIGNVTARNGVDSLVWNIPNDTTARGLVRVSASDGSIADRSNQTFSIRAEVKPSITLFYPNGGETFAADSTIRIRWQGRDLTGQLSVQYSVDSGAVWKNIGSRAARQGLDTLVWKVPNDPSTRALVRVGNADARDTSDLVFTIGARPDSLNPVIKLLYPNGGETFRTDSVVSIQWQTKNVAGQLNVQYSIDSGRTWRTIRAKAAVTGIDTMLWTVPDAPSTKAMVRVGPAGGGGAGLRDASDGVFTIEANPVDTTAPALQLLYPNGGEKLQGNSTIDIRWRATNLTGRLFVAYSIDGGSAWNVIDSVDAVNGIDSLAWTVPEQSAMFAYVLVSTPDGFLKDVSDRGFQVLVDGAADVDDAVAIAGGVRLLGCFPNPASNRTEIRWTQEKEERVTARLYDGSGGLARTIDFGLRSIGEHRAVVDLEGLAAGAYRCEIQSGSARVSWGVRIVR